MTSRFLTFAGALLTLALASRPIYARPECPAVPVFLPGLTDCATLVGTWQVQVYPNGAPSFTAVNVFYADGNSTEFDNSGAPSGQTIAVGPWKRVGDRKYSFLEINQLFDPTGAFAGTLQVKATITLNDAGDRFTSAFQFTVFDPHGTILAQGTGAAAGTRLVAN